jgi:hypothetical protein
MSGSGMISARPEGLAVDVEAEPLGCVSGWDGLVADSSDGADASVEVEPDHAGIRDILQSQRRGISLAIIMLAAAKCTEVQALADRGAIDGEGADLFIRRYSESICDIASALAPEAMRESMHTKGN